MRALASVLGSLLLTAAAASAQSVITLQDTAEEGKYTIETSVNGVGVRTYYTEENWFVSMSTTTYLFLYENGYILDEDVKGLAEMGADAVLVGETLMRAADKKAKLAELRNF